MALRWVAVQFINITGLAYSPQIKKNTAFNTFNDEPKKKKGGGGKDRAF